MQKTGENIYKRKDGRWEGRYPKERKPSGKALYGYVYAYSYKESSLPRAETMPPAWFLNALSSPPAPPKSSTPDGVLLFGAVDGTATR